MTRRFQLHRDQDETGISGTGYIADGVLFDDGTVAIRWRTANPCTALFADLAHAKAVHAHGGKTRFVFIDCAPDIGESEIGLCVRCLAEREQGLPYCDNCGAGGSIAPMLSGFVKLLKESACWVTRRFYPDPEYREEQKELRALRLAIGSWPGRSVVRRSWENGEKYWELRQVTTTGWTSTTASLAHPDETEEEALKRTADLLPWRGYHGD